MVLIYGMDQIQYYLQLANATGGCRFMYPRPELMHNIRQIIKSAMFRWQAALRSSRNVFSVAAMAATIKCLSE